LRHQWIRESELGRGEKPLPLILGRAKHGGYGAVLRYKPTTVSIATCFYFAAFPLNALRAVIFFDDFNRPVEPLGYQWILMESYLYIEFNRVVANSNEFGKMSNFVGTVYLEA